MYTHYFAINKHGFRLGRGRWRIEWCRVWCALRIMTGPVWIELQAKITGGKTGDLESGLWTDRFGRKKEHQH